MTEIPDCPKCSSQNTYPDGENFICPDCGHEWSIVVLAETADTEALDIRDANGNPLADGDSVVIIKDLKLRGSSDVLKIGTRVKNIRLVGGDHDIEGRIDGVAMMLKSKFVRKA